MSRLERFTAILMLAAIAMVAAAQPSVQIDTSNWETYRNEAMGFEVKYPNSWHVRQARGTIESVTVNETPQVGKANRAVQFIVQRMINPKGLSIRQWWNEQMRGKTPPASHQFIDTTIGGRPAIRREYVGSLGRSFDFFSSLGKSDILTIAISQPSSQKELDQTYEAVLATVKFIK